MNCGETKMAGKKGRSGRKARIDGKKMKAVSLYIAMEEIDISHFNSGSAKYQWVPEAWFRKFKRYFGVRWQDKVRWAMMQMVKEYQVKHLWRCKCTNDVLRWHKPQVHHCPECEYEPTAYERYKSYAERKQNEIVPVAKEPIKICTTCRKEPYTVVMDPKNGKVMYCKKCNPNRSTL